MLSLRKLPRTHTQLNHTLPQNVCIVEFECFCLNVSNIRFDVIW